MPVPRNPTVVEILEEFCDYAKSCSKYCLPHLDFQRMLISPKFTRSRSSYFYHRVGPTSVFRQIIRSEPAVSVRASSIRRDTEAVYNRPKGHHWARKGDECDLWSRTFFTNVRCVNLTIPQILDSHLSVYCSEPPANGCDLYNGPRISELGERLCE